MNNLTASNTGTNLNAAAYFGDEPEVDANTDLCVESEVDANTDLDVEPEVDIDTDFGDEPEVDIEVEVDTDERFINRTGVKYHDMSGLISEAVTKSIRLAVSSSKNPILRHSALYEVYILLTGDEEIQYENNRLREINFPTDVLSFPLISVDEIYSEIDAEGDAVGDSVGDAVGDADSGNASNCDSSGDASYIDASGIDSIVDGDAIISDACGGDSSYIDASGGDSEVGGDNYGGSDASGGGSNGGSDGGDDGGDDAIPLKYQAPDINPETDRIMLGDIVISLERAKAQATEYGHSYEREIAFLSIHGALHLCGYDHRDSISEKQMFNAQKIILTEMGF